MEPQFAVQFALTFAVNCWFDASLNVALNGLMVKAGPDAIASTRLAMYAVPVAAVAVIVHMLPGLAKAV